MNTFINVLTLTTTATSLFDAYDLLDFSDAKITADDQPVKGVALNPATEIGLDVGVIVLGTVRVKAVGVITKGMPVMSAATGGVTDGSAGSNAFATALTDAGDGEYVEILIR